MKPACSSTGRRNRRRARPVGRSAWPDWPRRGRARAPRSSCRARPARARARCASLSKMPGSRLLMVTLRPTVWRASPATKPTSPERAVRQPQLDLRDLDAARDDVEHAAEAARHHAVDRQPHHLDRAQHHRVERRDPVVARPGAEIARQRAVRVVEQDIGLRTGRKCGRASLRRGDVADDRCHLDAGRLRDLRAGLFEHVARARHDGDVDAFMGQRKRAGFAETSAGAAEQRLPAADAEVHCPGAQAATAESGPTL